jgi:predicted dehydrogenase
MDELRVGFVGLTGRGGGLAEHAHDLGYDIVAGADVDAEARASFAETYGATTYESYDALFEGANIDATVVATPNAFHAPAAVAALEAGVDVLVEKPLADSLDAAESVAQAEADSDAFGMVGFQRRFSGVAQALKAHVDGGRLGEVSHVEVNYARRRGIPGGSSLRREISGGGALIDVGVHVLDLALFLLDFPDLVEAMGTTRRDFLNDDDAAFRWQDGATEVADVEDCARGTLRTADGTTITVTAAWAQHQPDDYDVRLWGTDAGATVDFHGDELTLYEEHTAGADQLAECSVAVESTDPIDEELERFFEASRNGEPPGVNTIEQGLAVQRAVDSIYRSAERGRVAEC